MKKLLIIAILLINVSAFAQIPTGTTKVNNIDINGEIISNEAINTSPDYVITQDTTNNKTTYTEVVEVTSISFSDLTDSIFANIIDTAKIDTVITEKIILSDSSAIAISSNNDTLVTMPTMRDYVSSNSNLPIGNDGEILLSDGSGGAKTDIDLYFSGDTLTVNGDLDVSGNITGVVKNEIGTITDGDTTPDVAGYNILKYEGTSTSSITITDLDNSEIGAVYILYGTSDTYTATLSSGTNFTLGGNGASFILYNGNNIVFLKISNTTPKFIELSRTDVTTF